MKVFPSFLLLVCLTNFLHANEGEELYMEANCQKCHVTDDNKFDPKKSKAKNLENLKSWVHNCAVHFNVAWFPEEEKSVVKYLNETHYKF